MTRNAFIATIAAVALGTFSTLSASWADETPASASDANGNGLLSQSARTGNPETELRLADLRAYGHRFEKAIRLIEQEAAKPDWSWGDD